MVISKNKSSKFNKFGLGHFYSQNTGSTWIIPFTLRFSGSSPLSNVQKTAQKFPRLFGGYIRVFHKVRKT
jgi:hypothetical protein